MGCTDIDDINPEVLLENDTLLENNEVEVAKEIGNGSIDSATEPGFLLPADVVPIYVKSCSRRNFTVLLIRHLIEKEIRRKSNVSEKGKEKLDPDIVK